MAQIKSVVGFGYKHMVCLTLSVDLHLFLGPLLGFSPQPKVALVGILSLVVACVRHCLTMFAASISMALRSMAVCFWRLPKEGMFWRKHASGRKVPKFPFASGRRCSR